MTIKIIPLLSVNQVVAKAKYEGDQSEPSHYDKIVEISYHGAKNEEQYQQMLLASAAEKSATNTKKIVGYHGMGGTPLGWTMSQEERVYLGENFCERMGASATKIGWHLASNRHDYHFVFLNQKFGNGGALKGHRDPGMRRKAIAILDEIHEEINLMRRHNRVPIIPTMSDTRKRIAADRKREQLAELIARRAREARLLEWRLFFDQIKRWIADAGHEIDESRSRGPELSIRYAGTTKNRRHILKKLEAEVMRLLKGDEPPMDIDQDQDPDKHNPPI